MSRSIHTTYKDLKGLTKSELDEQFDDLNSDLLKLATKKIIKRKEVKKRKNHK